MGAVPIALEEVLEAGDTVVALGRYHGVYNGSDRAISAQFAHVWRVLGGRVTVFNTRLQRN